MDSTIAGLIGAAIGALAAIGSAFVTYTLQARQEHSNWLRDRKQEAYANSVRYIIKVLNKRSTISFESGEMIALLGKDAQKEWFDDISEALIWITTLSIYCSSGQRGKITAALDRVRDAVSTLMSGNVHMSFKSPYKGTDPFGAFSSAYETVSSSQRIDIG